MAAGERGVIVVPWVANPFRGDRFEEFWLPHAEAVMRYGAGGWAFFRSKEGLLDFTQIAFFEEKLDFERYWYSEEISAARAEASGLFQVPILPEYHQVAGMGGALLPAG
ncbi:MAG TPA: hypothetical protein VNT32_09410 [Thermoleophilaceae bacterium]|nr:hypothetical protein [Thermoleophilaceae bacterium]